MLKNCLLFAILIATGCTSVTKYETTRYNDAIISKDGRSVYVLKQRSLHTSTYFYAIVDGYDESDSLISSQIQQLDPDGSIENEITLDVETGGFETYNDSVVLLRDTSGSLLKVNLESGIVSRLQCHESSRLIVNNSTAASYTLIADRQSVSIFENSLYDDRATLSVTINLDSAVDEYGSPRYRYTNHLIGNGIICLYTGDSLFLCDVESGEVSGVAGIPGLTAILPVTESRFICSNGSFAGIYDLIGDSLTIVDTVALADFGSISSDTSANKGVRVEISDGYSTPLSRVFLRDIKTGSEKLLCAGSNDTLP